jgi:hypothetical protein
MYAWHLLTLAMLSLAGPLRPLRLISKLLLLNRTMNTNLAPWKARLPAPAPAPALDGSLGCDLSFSPDTTTYGLGTAAQPGSSQGSSIFLPRVGWPSLACNPRPVMPAVREDAVGVQAGTHSRLYLRL